MKIILIGFAASYKTSAGKILAEKLDAEFWDTDCEVENRLNKSVAEIISVSEPAFRVAESEVLCQLANCNGVISCGGGAVLSQHFGNFAKGGKVVWLQTSAETVRSRLCQGTRPLFDGLSAEELKKQISLREKLYQNFADCRVVTDGKTSQQVALEILQLL